MSFYWCQNFSSLQTYHFHHFSIQKLVVFYFVKCFTLLKLENFIKIRIKSNWKGSFKQKLEVIRIKRSPREYPVLSVFTSTILCLNHLEVTQWSVTALIPAKRHRRESVHDCLESLLLVCGEDSGEFLVFCFCLHPHRSKMNFQICLMFSLGNKIN